jgi:hypothetical protein
MALKRHKPLPPLNRPLPPSHQMRLALYRLAVAQNAHRQPELPAQTAPALHAGGRLMIFSGSDEADQRIQGPFMRLSK